MSMGNKYTIVFEVRDKEKFRELTGPLVDTMLGGEHMGCVVTAAGYEDSMTRADKLCEILDERGIDFPEELR